MPKANKSAKAAGKDGYCETGQRPACAARHQGWQRPRRRKHCPPGPPQADFKQTRRKTDPAQAGFSGCRRCPGHRAQPRDRRSCRRRWPPISRNARTSSVSCRMCSLAYAFDMTKLETFVAMYNDLMLGDSGLSKLEREMIAVAVSSQNRCYYCLTAHGAAVRQYSGNPLLGEHLVMNYRVARLNKRQRAMLDFAVKLTASPWSVEEGDRERLRRVGFTRSRHLGHLGGGGLLQHVEPRRIRHRYAAQSGLSRTSAVAFEAVIGGLVAGLSRASRFYSTVPSPPGWPAQAGHDKLKCLASLKAPHLFCSLCLRLTCLRAGGAGRARAGDPSRADRRRPQRPGGCTGGTRRPHRH